MSSMFDLSGRVAIVTGGNGGIGLGFAKGLVKAGASVSIWGRNADKLEAAKAELASFGTAVTALRCDVGDEEDVARCFEQVLETMAAWMAVLPMPVSAAG